jgi:hypothetical protein
MPPFAAMRGLTLVLVLAVGSIAWGSTRVELVIDEAIKDRSVAWPVTTGVPFALGSLTDAEHCRLVDDQGAEQLLQVKVAATWDAARTSIRWLTIDFIARPGRKYALEFGPEVRRGTPPQLLTIVDVDDVVVNTGAVEAEFVRRGPAAIGAVRIDVNGDGRIGPDEKIAGGPKDGDHTFTDQHGAVSTNARDEVDRTVVVESTGPVRAVVRVDGWYTGPKGERGVAYRTRYHLFAGLPLIKMIDEFRIVGSTRDVQFADIALPLELHLGGNETDVTAAFDKSSTAFGWNDSTRSVSVVQETFRHYGNTECVAYSVVQNDEEKVRSEPREKAGPWMQVGGEKGYVTGSLRNFWRQFPKEWQATRDRLTLHVWSPHVEPLDFGQAGLKKFFGPAGGKYLLDWQAAGSSTPISDFFYHAGVVALRRDGADGLGINKHHEVWYHFGPASQAAQGREYGALADQQPICLATGAWNVGTGVFGPLAARPNDSPYEKIVDRIFDLERYAQDTFGDYGWFLFGAGPHYSYQWDKETQRHYADPRRFEYHTYQRETQLWWCYLRSGERKFYDWCFPSENHWVDIAVAHSPTKYSTEWRGGVKQDAKLHYRPGDWSIDSPLHYVRHHDTGEAWLRSAPQFWASYHRTLETTTLAYYLTGDERYQDVIQFWKDYWCPLAGVRSDSQGDDPQVVPPWHREQVWFQPTKPGEPSKTWAEMLRDYAPFQSGSRHQQTLFFNLSTLYEHTWDPAVRQVLDEYAAAFVKPENPNGVWQCQDHHLPANADSPMLAHFWSPALWKYERATRDTRMPGVFKKYFTAAIEADPYGGDVGIYSNNQIAWGWWFTRDPRFLVAAQHELDDLLPNAEPLAKPEDLNKRIYNPYAPIKSLAAVPRLIAVLDDAKRHGIAAPQTPPLEPQRTLTAIARTPGRELRGVLWGWDARPALVDVNGTAAATITTTTVHRSHRQPFDRNLPGFHVYRQEFTAPPSSESWLFLPPKIETGLIELSGENAVWCWAGEPVQIRSGQTWFWRRSGDAPHLVLESAQARALRVLHDGRELPAKLTPPNRATFALADLPADAVFTIAAGEQPQWFRLADRPADECWVTPQPPGDRPAPPLPTTIIEQRRRPTIDPTHTFVPGRFGRALQMAGNRELQIPDEIAAVDGKKRRLSDQRQGSIEFWIRRRWDERLVQINNVKVLDAGSLWVTLPANLPLDAWCHVALDWFPLPNNPDESLVCLYIDGVDYGNYRSMYWAGYGARPQIFSTAKPWLGKFLARSLGPIAYDLDELRISNRPRYVDVTLPFGKSQTFNPNRFTLPSEAPTSDDATVLKLSFDDGLTGRAVRGHTIDAVLINQEKKR